MNPPAPGSSGGPTRGAVKQRGLRNWLLIPVVAASLPLAIFADIVVYMLWQFQQEQVQQRHVDTVRALAIAVGKEIETTVTLLQHLAQSSNVSPATLPALEQTLKAALSQRDDWRAMVLAERDGTQLFSTRGAPPARQTAEGRAHLRRVAESGMPHVSDVFIAPSSEWIVAVSVPVHRDGDVKYVLSGSLRMDAFDRMLRSQVAISAAPAAIFDSRHHFVSRSIEPERHRGLPAGPTLLAAMKNAREGTGRLTTREDIDVTTA